jgi:hypothetical protein
MWKINKLCTGRTQLFIALATLEPIGGIVPVKTRGADTTGHESVYEETVDSTEAMNGTLIRNGHPNNIPCTCLFHQAV